jgi:adenylate cyclase
MAFAASAAAVSTAVLVLRASGLLMGFELAAYDRMLRGAHRAEPTASSAVALIEITEEDIREQGHWPISDRTLAEAILALHAAGARVIGLDLYRDLAVPPGGEILGRVLRDNPTIIAVRRFGDPDTTGIPGPLALAGTGRVGFNDVVVDPDSTVRRAILYQDDGRGDVESSFALMIALRADGSTPLSDPNRPEWLRLGPTTLPYFEKDDGGYVGADDAGYQFLVDYAAGRSGLATWSLGALMRGEIDAAALRDKVVLLGSNAKSLPDLVEIPLGGTIPGVQIHAHMVDQLLRYARGESAPLRNLREWQEVTMVILVAVMGCSLALAARGSELLGVSALVVTVVSGAALIAFAAGDAVRAGWWAPVVAPELAWVGGAGLATAWLSSRERVQRAQLMGLFSRHLSPDVAEELWNRRAEFLRDGRPRPQLLPVTVLFVDMRGFSTEAKKMDPERLLEWMNDFLAAMAREVERHGGVIEDYFGDGLKANFGFPIPRTCDAGIQRDACQAVESGLAMGRALGDLNASFAARGLPGCVIRIGIDSGSAVAGSIGSESHLKYSAVGDVVVTAQRLEATSAVDHDFDAQPWRILISESTHALLGSGFNADSVGRVPLKGKEEGISVFRVRGAREPS